MQTAVLQISDLAYPGATDNKRALDLFIPSDAASKTLIAFVHGGAWISGDRKEFHFIGKSLAECGYITAILGYRLAPEEVFPSQLEDVSDALNFLHLQIHKFIGYHPDNLILMGHSAGAQLVSLIPLNPKVSTILPSTLQWIRGVVTVEGIFDILALSKSHPEFVDWFLDKAFPDRLKWEDASPTQTTCDPEALCRLGIGFTLVYSEDDEYKMRNQTTGFASRLSSFDGVQVAVEYGLGGGHDAILKQDNLIEFIKRRHSC